MSKRLRYVWAAALLGAVAAGPATAQNPTFSLEVTAINSVPIDPPVSRAVVAPGDIVTVEIRIRDWSPEGQKLRGYQARVNPAGYESGEAGKLSPVNFDETSALSIENTENAFLDTSHSEYVHRGMGTLAIVDSISNGYGWMSVLVNRDDAPVCPTNDGTRYYCGTLKLAVSEDARGLFTVALHEEPGASVLQNPESRMITPLDFEPLELDVQPEAITPRIVAAEPAIGAIDARMSGVDNGVGRGWKSLKLTFNTSPAGLTAADFTVDDGSPNPPRVERLVPADTTLTLVLDKGIRARAWTTIDHAASNTHARFGHLPGDADADGALTVNDVLFLAGGAGMTEGLPLYRLDIDRNGAFESADVHRVIDLLARPDAYRGTLP